LEYGKEVKCDERRQALLSPFLEKGMDNNIGAYFLCQVPGHLKNA